MSIQFRYFKYTNLETNKLQGVVTVATLRNGSFLYAGVSLTPPKTPFNKHLARAVSEYRVKLAALGPKPENKEQIEELAGLDVALQNLRGVYSQKRRRRDTEAERVELKSKTNRGVGYFEVENIPYTSADFAEPSAFDTQIILNLDELDETNTSVDLAILDSINDGNYPKWVYKLVQREIQLFQMQMFSDHEPEYTLDDVQDKFTGGVALVQERVANGDVIFLTAGASTDPIDAISPVFENREDLVAWILEMRDLILQAPQPPEAEEASEGVHLPFVTNAVH